MRIVVLEGSPHKKGSSNLLAGEFIRGAQSAEHTVQVLDVAHMDIHPCMGCDHCGMDGPCVQKDDVPKIQNALLSADMIVLVTPVYYFGMSAQLKMVIDRFYSYTMKLSAKGLKTAMVTAAWDNDMDAVVYLRDHYQKLCRYMNFKDCGMVLGTGCGTVSMTESTKYPKLAYELGKSI
ncbi:flavodoxin family protein [Lacrimispora brassicae]